MKKTFKIISAILIFTICMQAVTFAASTTPPKRPFVDTGKQNVSYSTPTDISFAESAVVIPMDEYNRNNPYKAYYSLETDSDGDPLIRIGNMCDNGYQIYGMTDEVDRYGTYIAIYPYKTGKDRLVLSSQIDEDISDTLIINIVESLDDTSSSRERTDVLKPPTREVVLSGTTSSNKKPERPVVSTTVDDNTDYEYDDTETEYEYEEVVIYEDAFEDVTSEHEHYIPIFTLKSAGIISGYSNGKFKPHNTITRAEACSMIINALENPDDISSKGNSFTDTYGHWAEDVIAKAKSMGIINGKSESVFAPEENITDEQLVKIIVCLLGYGKQAPYIGGYPNGYIEIASNIGLLDDVEFCIGNYTERCTLAKLIFNALNIYNAGKYKLVKLPDIESLTTTIQTKPANKIPDVDTEVEDDTDNEYNLPVDYEDEVTGDENDILKTVTSSITYITYEEAIIVSECITECIGKGTWETSDELYNIALQYSDEALLEEVSDIYNKLIK